MTRAVLVRRAVLGGIAAACCCLLVSACGGSAGPAISGAAAARNGPAAQLGPSASGLGASSGTGSKQAAPAADLAAANQSIIYTASLTMRAADVTAAAERAVSIATSAGGYVSDENAVSNPAAKSGASVDLTLKIPVPAYQASLAQLSSASIGTRLALRQQATDVTQQVADVASLVTSEQDAISALQGLLKRAASVSGLLQVQQQISSDESSLNSLQAQQRALNRETAYATVSMTLVGPLAAARHHKPARRGFLAGLAAGWRAFRHGAAWTATAAGAILPFLIIVAVLAAAGYLGRRRLARRRTAGTP